MTLMRWPLVCVALALFAAAPLDAQESAESIADLRARLEVLEAAARRNVLPAPPASAYYADTTVDTTFSTDDSRVRSIVEDYLNQRGVQFVNLESAPDQQPAAGTSQGTVVGADTNMSGKWTANGAELS